MVNYQDGKIYKIINSKNDIIYIGSTCQPLSKRMAVHRAYSKTRNSPIQTAMRQHGVDNFSIVLVVQYPSSSKEELYAKECKIMDRMLAKGVQLYNVIINGKLRCEKTRQKIIKAGTGRKHSEKTKAKMSEWHTGKKKSVEHRANLSKAKTNRGSLYYSESRALWGFAWYIKPGKQMQKVFTVQKHGYRGAKQMAKDARNEIYPK